MDSLLTSVGEGTELPKIDAKDTLIIFLALIGCVIFLISLKKIYYRFRLKKRYYIFPKISTKGISNIALVISISAAIILLLTLVTAGFMGILFRAYPGTRVTVEGILIKIGGLLFGPIIGVFIGGVTDLLSIALTAGMFHYGYFISACTYGLLAGFVRSIINISKGKRSVMISLGALYIGVCAMISIVYAWYQTNESAFNIPIFGLDIPITKEILYSIFAGVAGAGIMSILVIVGIKYRYNILYTISKAFNSFFSKTSNRRFAKKTRKNYDIQLMADRHLKYISKHKAEITSRNTEIISYRVKADNENKNDWLSFLIPVIVLSISAELVTEICIIPIFDYELGGGLPFSYWIGTRSLMLVIMVPFNILIIYPIYRVVYPTMNYKYENDIIESIHVPLIKE